MKNLEIKFTQKQALNDVANCIKEDHFFSRTVLIYFNDNYKQFYEVVDFFIFRTSSKFYCTITVKYDEYELYGGGSCSVRGEDRAKQHAIQEALDQIGVETSIRIPDSGLSYRCEEKIAEAIVNALGLNPKRCKVISAGGY